MKVILERDEYLKLKQYVLSSKDFLVDLEKMIDKGKSENDKSKVFTEIAEHLKYTEIENVKEIEDLLL